MTSERDFQKRLNRVPHDWQTRMVLADWLQERGDPRAEGYRAMGVCQIRAGKDVLEDGPDAATKLWFFWNASGTPIPQAVNIPYSGLPLDWFSLVDDSNSQNPDYWRGYTKTRRAAEDAAALAFAKLPEARRAELLTLPVLTPYADTSNE